MRAGPLLSLVLFAVPLAGEEMTLELDPARTEIHFTLGSMLHKVEGTFQLKRGTIRFDTATGKLTDRIPVGREPHGLTVWPQPGRFSLGHTGNMR